MIDRLACDLLSPHFQLHAWWHIFIALAAQQAFVLSVVTHGLEARGKVEIREWYGVCYLNTDFEPEMMVMAQMGEQDGTQMTNNVNAANKFKGKHI